MQHKLSIEQKKIRELFEGSTKFLIPDYQRPYAWDIDECLALWEDVNSFAFPEGDFDQHDEYFLGPIVLFRNDEGHLEVIDGQQRLITILLMLRAFYEAMKDFDGYDWNRDVRKEIGKCIWETNEQGEPYISKLKIDSQVATDEDKTIMQSILCNALPDRDNKDRYSQNFRFFQDKIKEFINIHSDDIKTFTSLPNRIINNCILLPIEALSQNTALRIFSTLNDRGKPLSDSDIFKVQLYKAFSADGKKEWFIEQWKELESLCEPMFSSLKNVTNPMDELFNRYMHYERARNLIKDGTQPGLRAFYEQDKYRLLKIEHERVFANLISLAKFWYSIYFQDSDRFSDNLLRKLFVLRFAPNAAWTLITSVYFIHNKNHDDSLNEEKFSRFLERITAFIWAYTIYHNASSHRLRTPMYKEMVNIVQDKEVSFEGDKFDVDELESALGRYKFSGKTLITRSMLAWWMMSFKGQKWLNFDFGFEIEHIHKKGTIAPAYYEMLGNQTLLERKIKSSASNLDFPDKRKYYNGIPRISREGTKIIELQQIAGLNSFNIKDINQRNKKIIDTFISFIEQNQLVK